MPIALMLAVLLSASSAPSGQREWQRYRVSCEKLHLDKLAALPERERDRIDVRLKLAPDEGPKTPVTLTIAAAGGPIVPGSTSDGYTEFPVCQDLLNENPVVLTSVPEGIKTAVTIDLIPRLPSGLSFPYADLFRAVEQANRFIRGQAGLLGFAAPRMKGIVLHFADRVAQTVRLSGNGVEQSHATDGHGDVTLLVEDSLLAQNPTVTLSTLPVRAGFRE